MRFGDWIGKAAVTDDFVMRALEELSVEETAQILDLNPQTVRTRFLRARRKLQERLQRELKLTFGEMPPFAGARCNRLIQRVLVLLEVDRSEARTPHTVIPSPEPGEG